MVLWLRAMWLAAANVGGSAPLLGGGWWLVRLRRPEEVGRAPASRNRKGFVMARIAPSGEHVCVDAGSLFYVACCMLHVAVSTRIP
jgi:hypothetical protein